VHNSKDPNFSFDDPKHPAIVSDAELPITFQGSPQGLCIFFPLCGQAVFDGPLDARSPVAIASKNVLGFDVWMINKPVGHAERSCLRTHDLFVAKTSRPAKSLCPLSGDVGEHDVFLS
jgi:hypothetical protein